MRLFPQKKSVTYRVLLHLQIILSLPTLFLLLPKLSVASLRSLPPLFHFIPMKINIIQRSARVHLSLGLPILAGPRVARGRITFLGCCLVGRTGSDTGIKIVDVADAGFS